MNQRSFHTVTTLHTARSTKYSRCTIPGLFSRCWSKKLCHLSFRIQIQVQHQETVRSCVRLREVAKTVKAWERTQAALGPSGSRIELIHTCYLLRLYTSQLFGIGSVPHVRALKLVDSCCTPPQTHAWFLILLHHQHV